MRNFEADGEGDETAEHHPPEEVDEALRAVGIDMQSNSPKFSMFLFLPVSIISVMLLSASISTEIETDPSPLMS